MSPAKVEHFSSKCKECEECSYFRICDFSTEERVYSHSPLTHKSFCIAQQEKLHYCSNANKLLHPFDY